MLSQRRPSRVAYLYMDWALLMAGVVRATPTPCALELR